MQTISTFLPHSDTAEDGSHSGRKASLLFLPHGHAPPGNCLLIFLLYWYMLFRWG